MRVASVAQTSCCLLALLSVILAGESRQSVYAQTPMPEEIRAGYDLIERGDFDAAEKIFDKRYNRDKKDVWAITGLGVVELRRGETTTQTFEVLLKFVKQDNTSKAIGKFRKALELQPGFLEARYFLGRAFINKQKPDDCAEAAAELAKVAQRDSLFRDTLYQLGLAHLGMEKWDLALADFKQALRVLPGDRRPGVKAADALFELSDAEHASEHYLDNIALVRNEEFLTDTFVAMRPLCTKEEKDEFENLPVAERGAFIRRFWRKRNPTPGTAANERLHEHYRRLKFARAAFHITMKPYYDDRGKIYLRYGKPQNRYVSPAYLGNVKNNESWSYENLQEDLVFDFVENGGIFREVDDLSQAAGSGTPLVARYSLAANLYAERSDMSLLYSRIAMASLGNASDLASRISEVSTAKQAAQAAATPEKYLHNYRAKPLEFAFSWAGFRGDAEKTQQEIYFGIPARQLGFQYQQNKSLLSTVQCAVVIEDSVYDEVLKSAWSTQIVAEDTARIHSAYPLMQRNVSLAPGNYNLTLQVADPGGQGLGIYKVPLHVRSFAGEDLMLSDIQFAFSIAPADSSAEFVKHNLMVRPYPLESLRRLRPIYLYYEIYNLATDAENRNAYRVEYEARVLKQPRSIFKSIAAIFGGGKKRGVSSSHEAQGVGQVAREYIALDLGNLPKSTVEISVRVTDTQGDRAALTSRTLNLQD